VGSSSHFMLSKCWNSAAPDVLRIQSHSQPSRQQNQWECSTDRLKVNDDGSCVLLKQGKCSIHPVRPTKCATYPFWSPHLASELDWRTTAATCEGISHPPSLPLTQAKFQGERSQGAAPADHSAQLMSEFRTSPQAGHGATPPKIITPTQA
jgi:Fe-S-cluster containining protein